MEEQRSSEDKIRDVLEKNSELVLEVQELKMQVAQKDKEKLELIKEINDLRLKVIRLRSSGATLAQKLDAGLQAASEKVLSHLVQASGVVTHTMELAKQYMQEREELELESPKWSHLSNGSSSSKKKVNEVPPLLFGGQYIQPVVSLGRTMLNNRSMHRSQNSQVTHRAVPMHMLQDVYIPLTRIDLRSSLNAQDDENENLNNSVEDLGLDDNEQDENEDESHNQSEELMESRLDAVTEESSVLDDQIEDAARQSAQVLENPLEGPSWMLDVQNEESPLLGFSVNHRRLEPDSTTPCDSQLLPVETSPEDSQAANNEDAEKENAPAFTPTIRRRKRTSSPPPRASHSPLNRVAVPRVSLSPLAIPSFSPRRKKHNTGRVLKVMVAKMRFAEQDPGGAGDRPSSPKRAALVHSPSTSTVERPGTSKKTEQRVNATNPNCGTQAGGNVCETHTAEAATAGVSEEPRARSVSRASNRSRSRCPSDTRELSDSENSSCSSEQEGGRSKRPRKPVSYKEKPLNRKLRR